MNSIHHTGGNRDDNDDDDDDDDHHHHGNDNMNNMHGDTNTYTYRSEDLSNTDIDHTNSISVDEKTQNDNSSELASSSLPPAKRKAGKFVFK